MGRECVADMAPAPTPWFTVEVACEDWYLKVEPLGIAVILSVTESLSDMLRPQLTDSQPRVIL